MVCNRKNSMEPAPRVSIIILNWNGWEDTIECLESVYQITYPNYDVIVVDNGSENDSLDKIREYCHGKIVVKSGFFEYQNDNKPIEIFEYDREEIESKSPLKDDIQSWPSNKRLILIKNTANEGFTEGNNVAMRFILNKLDSRYILLLNNDTVVDRLFLKELIKIGESNQNIGFMGPKIYFYNFNGKSNVFQFAGAKQNTWIFNPKHIGWKEQDKGQYNKNSEVDYIHGSCVLAKVMMIKQIGLLDKDFFSYREENDWGIRGLKKGWKSVYAFRSKIWHKGGGSTKNENGRSIATYYLVRNNFMFIKKHARKIQQVVYLCYFFSIEFWYHMGIILIYKKDLKNSRIYLRGIRDGIKILIT